MIIPHQSLTPSALRGIAEEFVTREGTDYGTQLHSFEEKVQAVLRQIETGVACVVFDAVSESCDIVMKGSSRYRQVVASMDAGTE